MSGCQGSLEARCYSCFLSDSPRKPVGAEEGGKQTGARGLFPPAFASCLSVEFESDDAREFRTTERLGPTEDEANVKEHRGREPLISIEPPGRWRKTQIKQQKKLVFAPTPTRRRWRSATVRCRVNMRAALLPPRVLRR